MIYQFLKNEKNRKAMARYLFEKVPEFSIPLEKYYNNKTHELRYISFIPYNGHYSLALNVDERNGLIMWNIWENSTLEDLINGVTINPTSKEDWGKELLNKVYKEMTYFVQMYPRGFKLKRILTNDNL